jgi:hypothetical protein
VVQATGRFKMPQFDDDLFLGSAQTYMGLKNQPNTAVITATISGTTLTVSNYNSGDPLTVGSYVSGSGVTAGTYITANLGGGQYTVSASQTVSSATTMYVAGNALLGDPAPMDLGVGPLGRSYVFDVIPEAPSNTNISAAATYSTAGNATLAAGAGVQSVIRADGTTVLQLDCPRAVSITIGTGTITATNVTISGYDYYGQAMTQVISTGTTQSTTINGKKAFYQISSVAVAGNCGGTISVGTSSIIGLPVRCIDAGYISSVGWANQLGSNSATFVAADTTNPATSSTGDVRGTIVPNTSTGTYPLNGQNRLVVEILLTAIAVGPNSTRIGALGVTQA